MKPLYNPSACIPSPAAPYVIGAVGFFTVSLMSISEPEGIMPIVLIPFPIPEYTPDTTWEGAPAVIGMNWAFHLKGVVIYLSKTSAAKLAPS